MISRRGLLASAPIVGASVLGLTAIDLNTAKFPGEVRIQVLKDLVADVKRKFDNLSGGQGWDVSFQDRAVFGPANQKILFCQRKIDMSGSASPAIYNELLVVNFRGDEFRYILEGKTDNNGVRTIANIHADLKGQVAVRDGGAPSPEDWLLDQQTDVTPVTGSPKTGVISHLSDMLPILQEGRAVYVKAAKAQPGVVTQKIMQGIRGASRLLGLGGPS